MYKSLLSLLAFFLLVTSAKAQTYCTPASSICSSYILIENVTAGSLNNNSACSPAGYIDYTNTLSATALYIGIGNPIKVKVGTGGPQYVAAWIDYDRNGVFDANEYTAVGTGEGSIVNGIINIAGTVTPGITRMRVRTKFNVRFMETENCAAITYGETEDYQVNLVLPAACTGTPDAGNTISSATAACGADSITLTVNNSNTNFAGLTYQWQSSEDSVTWNDIAGATAIIAGVYQDSTLLYRRRTTCGTASAVSVPVKIIKKTLLQCYCRPAVSNCTQNDVITKVTLGTFIHNSSCSSNGFGDYTEALSAIPVYREPTEMTVTVGPGGVEHVSAWIDYDRNGLFDKNEYYLIGSGNGVTLSKQISIPATAPIGITRMRVRVRYNSLLDSSDACSLAAYGETQDYLVNILAPTSCINCYCIPEGSSICSDGDVLNRVQFGTLDTVTSCSSGGYGDFTSNVQTASFNANNSIPMTLEVGCANGSNMNAGVWIDFDHDGIFDRSEFTLLGKGCGTITGNISIPCNAVGGESRMRIRVASDTTITPSDACKHFLTGETEDYKIILVASNCALYTWTGNGGDNNWETAANWSCQQVPGINSIVVINSGNVVVNSNVTIYSLRANASANITVSPSFNFTTTH